MPTISRLFRYPVKSCRRVELTTAQIAATGVAGDREYMIIDAEGVLISQREVAELALIDPEELIALAQPSDDIRDVTLHAWHGKGADQGEHAARFLKKICNVDARLVKFPDSYKRKTGVGGGTTKYPDGYPVLVVSESSLDDVNRQLGEDFKMERFRPSIVLSGIDQPWAEDEIGAMRVGQVNIDLVKPCARCTVITVDQDTAEVGREPLKGLGAFRVLPTPDGRGIIFGMNGIPRTIGEICVGDEAHVEQASQSYLQRFDPAKG